VHETGCCGAIICETCGPQLKKCPNRWTSDGIGLALNVNKFIQRMINHIKAPCEYCKQEFTRSEISDHKENCEQNKLKPVVMNPALHWCVLYKKEKSNDWFWDGLRLVNHGWALTGTSKRVIKKHVSWYWDRCDVDFCENCIQAYSDNTDESDMRWFKKDGEMHLTHPHKLNMYFGSNLPEQARKNWFGKHKKSNCQSEGKESLRYLVCYDCKIVLWEKCYLSNSDDFLHTVPGDVHKHILHLQAIPSTFTWGCDVKSPNCLKRDHQTNKDLRISFRCDVCDFDICIKCLEMKNA